MKQAPQVIHADRLTEEWPKLGTKDSRGTHWVLARPMSLGGLFQRAKLALKVFTGEYDALKWRDQ